jgi:hypothetical protein
MALYERNVSDLIAGGVAALLSINDKFQFQLNAIDPMAVTDAGIVILFKLLFQ